MKVIILAAGQGTRLRPYTDDRPKCMVELAGCPILHHQLAVLRQAQPDEIILVGGYESDQLDIPGVSLLHNFRYDQTNMVSTLFCAGEHMQAGEDLLITYGDIVFEKRVLDAVLECDGEVVLGADLDWRRLWELRMDDPLSDAETFVMTGGNRVTELGKQPKSYEEVQAQYMGVIRVRGDKVRDFISAYGSMDRGKSYDGKDFDNMYMTSFLQHLIDSGWDVRAALVNGGWLEIDTADELESFNDLHKSGELDDFVALGTSR